MVEYEIFGMEVEKDIIRLALRMSKDKDVEVVAVDKFGEVLPKGRLLYLGEDGEIHRVCDIPEKFGFRLDKAGRIVLGN